MKRLLPLLICTMLILLSGCGYEDTREVGIPYSDDEQPDTKQTAQASLQALDLNTEDINGKAVNNDLIKDSSVVIVNFWEPWCGPCVGEIPDIDRLYNSYKDQGLMVIGVFSTVAMENDVKSIIDENNISYPIIKMNENMQKFTTEYVPTTYFFDKDGNLLSPEPIVGANSYEDWEKIIQNYLK